ncbi:MAG: hypothetical protein ACE14Q_01120 [Acidobacteriota bacterium]
MKNSRMNFAETPFINLKIPTTILIVLGTLAVAGLLLNIVLAILNGGSYIKQRKILATQSQTKEALEKRCKEADSALSAKDFNQLAKEAQYLQDVLSQKQFSWLTFLERLETIKPYKAIFQSISPKARKDGSFYVKVKGLAQPRDEIFKLEENIFKSQYFGKPHLSSEELDKTSQWQSFDIEFVYFPEGKK